VLAQKRPGDLIWSYSGLFSLPGSAQCGLITFPFSPLLWTGAGKNEPVPPHFFCLSAETRQGAGST